MQHLAVAQLNHRARRAFDLQPHDAGEVLAEVEDVNTVGRRRDGDGLDLLRYAHRQAGKGFEPGRRFEAEVHRAAFDFDLFAGVGGVLPFVERSWHAALVLRENRRLPRSDRQSRPWPSRAASLRAS